MFLYSRNIIFSVARQLPLTFPHHLCLPHPPLHWQYLEVAKGHKLEDGVAKFFASNVVLALQHLHEHHIVHRDVKPENLVLGTDGYLRLVDFGSAKEMHPSARTFTFCGTPDYVAPEVLTHQGHGQAVDFWAVRASTPCARGNAVVFPSI